MAPQVPDLNDYKDLFKKQQLTYEDRVITSYYPTVSLNVAPSATQTFTAANVMRHQQ